MDPFKQWLSSRPNPNDLNGEKREAWDAAEGRILKIYNGVLEFAMTTDSPREFLTAWMYGEWDTIRQEWPKFGGYLGE